jgi:polyhydroxyalkanoate depolymerase
MAQGNNPAAPRSITLMAGPIDCRINPTKVNDLAKGKPIDWFEKNLIATVPARYPGGGRKVYPCFIQLAAFMSMNLERHLKAHRELYENLAKGEEAKAAQIKVFYDKYFAVLDLAAEFYLETVKLVFQDYALPLGQLTYQTRRWSPRRSSAPCCSRSRARRTIFAPSGRRSPRMICVQACGPIANATTCRPASATMACSPDGLGSTRSIPW